MMMLHWSSRSPFVRQVMMVAHETGQAGRIRTERVVVTSLATNPAVMRDNPLGKIPALRREDVRRAVVRLQREAQVVGAVARRVQRGQPPLRPFEHRAVGEPPVGDEGVVAALAAFARRGQVRAEAVGRHGAAAAAAERGAQAGHALRVVVMGVRDQDARDPPALGGAQDRRAMRRALRPRVEHGDVAAAADQVGVGAAEGEGARIVAADAAQAGGDLLHRAGRQGILATEGDTHLDSLLRRARTSSRCRM